ncbi:MAG: hypothetical protein HUJ63_10040, partial [Enterococcus sp.]|nr:hypothetical protein [Enterococcus sp.]
MEKFYLTKSIVPRGTTTETQTSQTIGVPSLGNTTAVITNEYANAEIIYVNITDLLDMTSETVNKEALYLTFSSGSEEEGWHTGGTFAYKTYTYDDGTFMRWFDSVGEFVAVSAEMAETADTAQNNPFEPMPSNIYIFKNFSSGTSKKIVQGTNYGIWLGNVENYKLQEGKLVKQNFTNAYGVTSPDISISVPYAYEQDGQYHGGCLDDADYAKFKQSSGITIDTVIPSSPSNDHVPSTKLLDSKITPLENDVTYLKNKTPFYEEFLLQFNRTKITLFKDDKTFAPYTVADAVYMTDGNLLNLWATEVANDITQRYTKDEADDLFVKKSSKITGVWKITKNESSYTYTEIYKSSDDFFLNLRGCSGHVLAIEFTSMPTRQQLQEFMKKTKIDYTIMLDSK